MQHKNRCSFHHQDYSCSEESLSHSPYCYWHDPEVDKTGPDIKEHLEKKVRQGESLCGYQLVGAKLDGIHIASHDDHDGANLTGANLKRASLYNAHLYRANLTNACLMKANLGKATLNFANLDGANLLGVFLSDSKLEHIHWGKLHQEVFLAKLQQKNAPEKKIQQMTQEAEEVCRQLRKQCEEHGLSENAGKFFYKEMRFRRFSKPLFSRQRFFSWFFDRLCGYGEKPRRLIAFSLFFITLCAIGYFFIGVHDGHTVAVFNASHSIWENLTQFGECLYFSVVTFTTLGYGDITPAGFGRLIAAVEAFTGSFTIALYVVVFVRRMSH